MVATDTDVSSLIRYYREVVEHWNCISHKRASERQWRKDRKHNGDKTKQKLNDLVCAQKDADWSRQLFERPTKPWINRSWSRNKSRTHASFRLWRDGLCRLRNMLPAHGQRESSSLRWDKAGGSDVDSQWFRCEHQRHGRWRCFPRCNA